MASWAQGYPSLITDCPTYNPHPEWPRYYSPADVTNEQLYKVLDVVLTELKDIFVDQHWHVGGDEPHYQCWDLNEKIVNYKMKQGNWTNNQLYSYFSHRYGAIVRNHNKSRIGWDEMYTIGGKMPPTPGHDDDDSIVHVWTDNTKLAEVVHAGLRGIISENWYLNNGGDWTKYYNDDPMSYLSKNATSVEKDRVLGGEACMWMSAFDSSSNMSPTIWPNAAAVAERLWSGKENVQTVDKARTRLSQQRCRMIRRGVAASPIAEDYCDDSLYVRKSRSFVYPGDFPVDPETPGP